jgi:hypothetical protein
MRGLSEYEFSNLLKESFVSVWVDDVSGFGTYPIESMRVGTPVLGKIPNIKPSWMNEHNGIWTNDVIKMVDILAEFTQNWLEDNISSKVYESSQETAEKFSDINKFNDSVITNFTEYVNTRRDNFESQLNKLKEDEK